MERQVEGVEPNDDRITRASDPSEICRRCYEQLDVDKLLNPRLEIDSKGHHVKDLPELGIDILKKWCFFCGFMISAGNRDQCPERLTLLQEMPVSEKAHTPRLVKENQRFLAFHGDGGSKRPWSRVLAEAGFLFPIPRSGDHACPVHIVDRNAISYIRITKWLDDCAANHHAPCVQAKEITYSLQLYVLDCMTNTIVSLPFGHKYVALSYVWGMAADLARDQEPPIGDAQNSTWPPPEIPLTIRDSMEATRCLGYRYLWVDRYCIPQLDSSQRHEAIAKMDQVYTGAVFTIVALDGATVHSGLAGVSTRQRSNYQELPVKNGQVRWTFPNLSSVIDRSVWATRGWTFQEFRLSHRCLFFTDFQVYFSCSKATLSEALPETISGPTLMTQFSSNYSDQVLERTNARHRGFFLDRRKYTSKTLSYQSDILDAFRGIIGLHPFVTLWGIPITCTGWRLEPCVGFAMGLLWRRDPVTKSPTGPSRRRPGFPTWSWTSVFGPIDQYTFGEYQQTNEQDLPESEYGTFLKSGSARQVRGMEGVKPAITVEIPNSGETLAEKIEMTETKVLPESSTSIIIQGNVLRLNIETLFPYIAECHFHHENETLDYQRSMIACVDATGPGEQPAATIKTLEGVQDALVIVEWSDSQPETEVRFALMLLRWVGDNIAERVGLVGDYDKCMDKAFVDSLPRRCVKFELR